MNNRQTVKISPFHDSERGGRRVRFLTFDRQTTVMEPGGLERIDTRKYYKDVGTLMGEVENHVPEQPMNRYKRVLIERQREAATLR